MKKPLKIGLTGGIGSGKSSVLRLISEEGAPVLQTDLIGHELLKKNKTKKKLVKKFGGKIIGEDGEIDRKALAKEIFQDARNQKTLNELLHPAIRKTVAKWIARQAKIPCSFVVVEVPLLFERGYNQSFDRVLSVSAPREIRRKRLLNRGWDIEDIQRRENSQWSQLQKNKKADWVLFNRGSRKDLKNAVRRWMKKAEKMAVQED